jgi:hypothetical protein
MGQAPDFRPSPGKKGLAAIVNEVAQVDVAFGI